MRWAAGIEYSGQAYAGWQCQADANSVQAEVERAIGFVANHPIHVICAGRTDKGVHASGQVIHFDTTVERSEHAWRCGVNSQLPRDISIQWIKPLSENFHARFSAQSRRYQYYLYCHESRPGILADYLTWHMQPLALDAMIAASDFLLGEHDFTSFRASHCQAKSPIRTIQAINWQRRGEIICLDIRANGFLHHMVRNIVGVMLRIGRGEQDVQWTQRLLQSKDRKLAAATAPPNGLYLVDIEYPCEFAIPMPRRSAWFELMNG